MAKLNSVLITGANRGIGLQLVKSISAKLKPQFLFATYRDEAKSQVTYFSSTFKWRRKQLLCNLENLITQ